MLWKLNVESTLLSIQIISKFLSNGGLGVFLGARSIVKHKNPNLLAYSMTKHCVIDLMDNVSVDEAFKSLNSSLILLLPYHFNYANSSFNFDVERFSTHHLIQNQCRTLKNQNGLQLI